MGKERYVQLKTARELRNEQKLKCLIGIIGFIVILLFSALVVGSLVFGPIVWAKDSDLLISTVIKFIFVFVIDAVVLLGISNYLVKNKARFKDYYNYRKAYRRMDTGVNNVLNKIIYVNKFYKREGNHISHPKCSSTYALKNGKHKISYKFYRDDTWCEVFNELDEILEQEFNKSYDSKCEESDYVCYEFIL